MLEANKEIKVEVLNKLGYHAIGRMNFLYCCIPITRKSAAPH